VVVDTATHTSGTIPNSQVCVFILVDQSKSLIVRRDGRQQMATSWNHVAYSKHIQHMMKIHKRDTLKASLIEEKNKWQLMQPKLASILNGCSLSHSVLINNLGGFTRSSLLRDKLHQLRPSGYQVTVAEGQLHKWDNVTQGHLQLMCNMIYNVGQTHLRLTSFL